MEKKQKKAIVFLTKYPHKNTIDFAVELGKDGEFETFIVVDSMDKLEPVEGTNFIQVADDVCRNKGYHHSNIGEDVTHIKKDPIAWDKFCYYFCEIRRNIDYFWVFEDDVFVPSINTVRNLHEGYSRYDLVVANNNVQRDTTTLDWHWKHIVGKIRPPFHYSMVCGMGISARALRTVKEYVDVKKSLFYIEVMFNTLVMHRGLLVVTPLELKTIVWQGEWGIDHFVQLPNNVFHPVKDIENHPKLREEFADAMANGYTAKKELPQFILDIVNEK
jgi:hypothetical protein